LQFAEIILSEVTVRVGLSPERLAPLVLPVAVVPVPVVPVPVVPVVPVVAPLVLPIEDELTRPTIST
jgi:hypothetical protein